MGCICGYAELMGLESERCLLINDLIKVIGLISQVHICTCSATIGFYWQIDNNQFYC